MASANVITLSPPVRFEQNAKVVPLVGRAQLLEMRFDSALLDVIGVQEGRIAQDQRISGIVYEMLKALPETYLMILSQCSTLRTTMGCALEYGIMLLLPPSTKKVID